MPRIDHEQDVLELGERVADCFLREGSGDLYTEPEDREWAFILYCYGLVRWNYGDSAAGEWYPDIDEHGMWTGRRRRRGEP